MKIVIKILNRLKLLKLINITYTVNINKQQYKIPIIQGIGFTNINHQNSWFTDLLLKFDNYYNNIIFYDVGANIGQTLLNVKTINSNWKYIGFEPNSSCLFYLKQLIKKNNFLNTTIYPIALSNKLNLFNLNSLSEVDSSATIIENFRPEHYINGTKEYVIGLDLDFLQSSDTNTNNNHIIKIDVEGSELMVLEGMKDLLNKTRAIVICEVLDTHSKSSLKEHQLRLQKLESFLHKSDYHIYQIIKNKLSVSSLKLITNFEVEIWNINSIELNDYLFVPKEKQTILKNIFESPEILN